MMQAKTEILQFTRSTNINTKKLIEAPILQNAYTVSRELGISIFLVGGAVRDILLSSVLGRDFDFACQGEAPKVAEAFARKVGGTSFPLDPERGHYRVAIKQGAQVITVDFSVFRGHGIRGDLRERDFTINAMAISLRDLFEKDEIDIIDPLNGLGDMERKTIRVCSSGVFDDDPTRLIRAVRISAATNLVIENQTEILIRRKKDLLAQSSWERIRDELFLILLGRRASESIRRLDSLGLLNVILPEVNSWKGLEQGKYHNDDLFDHALKTVEFIEAIRSDFSAYFPDHGPFLEAHFEEVLESNVTRHNLLKLTGFLHDSGKVETQSKNGEKVSFFGHEKVGAEINRSITTRLKLGKKSSKIITNVTKNHMRILNVSKSPTISRRAKYRFFTDLGKEGMDCLVLSLADGLATRTRGTGEPDTPLLATIGEFLTYYFGDWATRPRKPLLDGKEVMTLLEIPEGRAVGRLLAAIQDAQLKDLISSKEEAKEFIKKQHSSG